ncbi:unnamed protein product [Pedinophyceae sp. YPF-701]|nr:unnamed protein product [Pedinophyceae sp. YPF-701]
MVEAEAAGEDSGTPLVVGGPAWTWIQGLLSAVAEEEASGEGGEGGAQAWLDAHYVHDVHDPVLSEFVFEADKNRLFAMAEKTGKLVLSTSPPMVPGHLLCLYRAKGSLPKEENYRDVVHKIKIGGQHSPLESLLRLMNTVYVPTMLENTSWPQSMRTDIIGSLHKFMASLTEHTHEMAGKTVLYIPKEQIGDPMVAAKDKQLVQRLEATVIHWTRQIKEVVNNLDNSDLSDDAGPLAEIEFWRARSKDMSSIQQQLEQPLVARFVDVLEAAKSSYLGPFMELSKAIQTGGEAARDNLLFLQSLQEPCGALAKAAPKDIPGLMPNVLNHVRMIWSLSRHYNTEDAVTGLLRNISNEIITRCCAHVSLEAILSGDVDGVMVTLQESVRAGESWKGAYRNTAAALERSGSRPWKLDQSSIFAHIDAFVQRCKDLLEICEAQLQFAPSTPLPNFGGTRGPEVVKSIRDIQGSFQKLVKRLRDLGYSILDVKVTRWHDDYNVFKSGVKDLEVMFTNVVVLALDAVPSLPARINLLEIFFCMAKRESVKRTVEKKTSELYQMFTQEINVVKKQLDLIKRSPPPSPFLPRYAGAAYWAQALLRRIAHPLGHLLQMQHALPDAPEAGEVFAAFELVKSSVEQFTHNMHRDWYQSVPADAIQGLERSLIAQEDGTGTLVVNFDKGTLSMFQEVYYWERLRMEIPYVAMEINAGRERLRVLRESILLVVRDYNQIIGALDRAERRLFADRIRYLDRRVAPGLLRLTWTSPKAQLDYYVKEARRHCKDVWTTVEEWKQALRSIEENCRMIVESQLINVEKKRVYDHTEFFERQMAHMSDTKKKFRSCYEAIKSTMDHVYKTFADDSEEVQAEWYTLTKKVDRKVEDALRATWKRSLQELMRALDGDKKTEVVPIFHVLVVLQNGHAEVKPTIQELYNMIFKLRDELVRVAQAVPRLRQAPMISEVDPETGQEVVRPRRQLTPFYEILLHENRADKKTQEQLVNLGEGITAQAKQFLDYWEKKYQHVWDQDKDAYIRRYKKADKPLLAFNGDTQKYQDLGEEVMAEDTSTNMRFMRVDCSPLKQSIHGHCNAWVGKFTGLLHDISSTELNNLFSYFRDNKAKLAQQPANLDELASSVTLQRKLAAERESTEARFQPLRAKYESLEKFGVGLRDAERAQLDELEGEWASYLTVLEAAEGDLERAKETFREKLVQMVDSFVKDQATAREEFEDTAPYSHEKYSVAEAKAYIKKWLENCRAARKRASDLTRQGMEIFAIPTPPYKELEKTEAELRLLGSIWDVVEQWESAYSGWKDGLFKDLNVQEMEEAAVRIQKTVTKLGREVKHWPLWGWIKETIESFKRTMPLIIDLRNPAMRKRHWQNLMAHIGEQFDPESDSFTLSTVVSLRLDQHAEFIGELSGSASKELAIEVSLGKIGDTWETLELDLAPYKATFKLRSTEDIFAALEDNVVTLSTMKGSKFFVVFEKEILRWEHALSLVSESIEMIQQVQRNWMYLENIFVGSEDIRKQLPQESILFESVHTSFQESMKELHDVSVVVRACDQAMLDRFVAMDEKLEKIQKSLENYLESKRQQFPRFYFLSSDDLLEILGQAKDPLQVQKHLKKCFEGIKRLQMYAPGQEGHKVYEATGIFSPDGEWLPFPDPVRTEGRPEDWLNDIEAAMFKTTKLHLYKTLEQSKGAKKERWVRDNQGQMIISAGQILWTAECEAALADPDEAKKALRQLKKRWMSYLNKLTGVTRSRLTKIERNKVVALITIEVHARDVIDKLGKTGCSRATDFEWVSQLRFYWDRDQDDCVVKQVLSIFTYGYEYQGNNGRLVITPLTDRCYMTLGAAMFTRRGGNPLGPAGTGKTETVKDFGKALARYVIVFNCSDGVDYKMTGKMLSGLAQTGAWACLDEFNRIEVEVLSVVATQISTLMLAIKERKRRFQFLGQEIRLIPSCAVFVTMNPGYAGRSELPDNLKAIVRPVAMMVPDFTLIAEIMMFSEGFQTAKSLAKKMIAIMELSQQQLSKQDHYDYGLRSFVIPIARAAGAHKRAMPDASEEVIMYRTMIDLIKPKLVYQDLPLFMSLLSDLFPGVEMPTNDGGELRKALEAELTKHGLQIVPEFVTKIIQIFDCKLARHGNMIVGKTGSGKSEAWKCLQRALARLCKQFPEEEAYEKVHVYTINPLALSNDELYGAFEPSTQEWRNGVLARIMRDACNDTTPDQKWILFDGPVDTLWIESMNTLLDDNKLLTLLNGERISMTPQVSILFEVEDLSQASPATVSRAGMIYLNVEDLGWRPYVTSWLQRPVRGEQRDPQVVEIVQRLVDKYIEASLEHKRLNCSELVPIDRLNGVRTFCSLFDHFATPDNGVSAGAGDSLATVVELWFQFALVWSVGASLDEEGRKSFDMFLRELDSRFPPNETVFEYYVDPVGKQWVPWEQKLSSTFRVPTDTPFFKIMIPTIDTVRTQFVAGALVQDFKHVLVVGNVGVGKTMIVDGLLQSLPDDRTSLVINSSAQTSSNSLQDSIEGRLVKRTKGIYGPDGGKKMIAFIDDLNMPAKSKFGFIPPLELLKLWVDNGFWYDRLKCEAMNVVDMQLLAAMAPPGGGRNKFSQRIQACFSTLNVTPPNDAQLKRIFSTLLNSRLADFEDEIRPLGDLITQASIAVFRSVASELLPTPSKSHYLFNTRDLAKVIQGVMQATKAFYDSKESMLALWCHETFRIIGDRMWDHGDKAWLRNQLNNQLTSLFGSSYDSLFEDGEMLPYVSFMRPMDNPPYEAVQSMGALKETLTTSLEDYGLEPGNSQMDLVLFKDAMHHVCRIHRILMQPRGNALLVGVGGSGRKSLARLATYIAEQRCFSIEITKNYRQTDFREDLKMLYKQAGQDNKPTTFLFDETQIKLETFLEDVNNILTSGEVPNLFPKDEMTAIVGDLRPQAKKAGVPETEDGIWSFFMERVRTNLHVILCLSPVGEAFRERCRMFPGLVNCTTIDWFTEWPADALLEVAERQLEDLPEDVVDAALRTKLGKVFQTAHSSVVQTSARMLAEVKRANYVTPTNYLETVRGYKTLLGNKRGELIDKARKLKGGLEKLAETSEQVQEMQEVAKQKKVVVARAKKECEELLVQIVQDKRTADEQEKQVNAEATKIGKEAEEADAIANECKLALDKALPALEEAEAALSVLDKKDISELKAYSKPPAAVELTLGGVLTVLKRPTNWDEAKKQMGDAGFLSKLMNYDKDQLVDALLKKINKFTSNADFDPEKVGKVSKAAEGMCKWVHAMEKYGEVSKEVAPKKAKLKLATDTLNKKKAALKQAQDKLAEVLAQVQALEDKYNGSMSENKRLEDELADLEGKLERAEKLVTGLAGEKDRWETSIALFEDQAKKLPGDCVVAAAFMSYAGPFPSEYRDELVVRTWLPQVKNLQIPASDQFDFCMFLADPADVRDWNIQGLPADSFSTENGVLVTRGQRWPLMIDPQGQANKWVKNMEGGRGLKVLNLQMSDMIRQMESCIQFGAPALIQDVLEEVDPTLEPVLSKAFIRRGNNVLIKLGDKEIDYNPEFKLYLTTKLANPHYTPEISTKVTLVNFAVKESGLDEQLLNLVVKCEQPELDRQKNELVVKVARGKRTQAELEDQILQMLATATGSLLDNVELIQTLDQSKTTWEEVNESLKVAEETSRKITAASEEYRPVSTRAALLYFVLNDLALIDPMYQFSLDAYVDLFHISINNSPHPGAINERIRALNDYHTYAVYKYTARGLFERHKLLLSLQMTARILANAKQINQDEWQALLRGASVMDRSSQPPNPAPHWISELAWDSVTTLEELPNFQGLVSSFDGALPDWENWYRSNEPEAEELPGEWESRCNELQRMVLVRALRPDRLIFAATAFVANALGRKFVEPPVLDLAETYNDSVPASPLIFVLSPGVDPYDNLAKLAKERNMTEKFHSVALGQGQAPVATKLISDGLKQGHWVFLANCHLMTSWLPTLDKIIESFAAAKPHPNFRLWLSSNPDPKFPIAILQRSIKMTTEPPKGLRANLLRLYNTISEESFAECKSQDKYQKLLFALCFFHSVLLERRKFRTLGLNIPYDFNDTDMKVSDDLLKSYLDSYEDTPWEALKYLISEANYGGRVTDELDRRVLRSYLEQYYCDEALVVPNYKLSTLPHYFIPDTGTLQSFKDYVLSLPLIDAPQAFGQHPNADISCQTEDSMVVLDSLLSLQPKTGGAGAGGDSADARVDSIAEDLRQTVPQPFNLEQVMKSKASDPSALHVVLFQEVERYNVLLAHVHSSCHELQRGIKGLVVMSADLDMIYDALSTGKVPAAWLKAYPSLKPLGSWARDLLQRIEQLKLWIDKGYPDVYWLSGFTYPTGFLTAVLQTTARRNGIPIDTLSFDFTVMASEDEAGLQPPREGVYVRGIFLEGAGWDYEQGCLCEPEPMKLIVPMPIVLFKPVENKKKPGKSTYLSPLYLYPVRTGTRERPSFMINMELKTQVEPDHWVKRGTATLLSLST